jgi:hypothetical protein
MARPSLRARPASAIALTVALIAPSLALAASEGGGGGTPAPVAQPPSPAVEPAAPAPEPAVPQQPPPVPPATGGAPAPAPSPPVPQLEPTGQLADAAAAVPHAVASQETESPGEVPNLQKFGKKAKPPAAAPAQATAPAGRLPHTGYLPVSVAILGLAMLAAGTSTVLLVPRS